MNTRIYTVFARRSARAGLRGDTNNCIIVLIIKFVNANLDGI